MPDKLITEIPLIERYARHNEEKDWRFRNFIKHRLNLSSEALDEIVREETDVVTKQIDCTKCAHCCKSLQPSVDDDDVKRLAAHVGISTREFSKRYVTRDEFGDNVMAEAPCPFLGGDNRCTVYEIRPKACQNYPYLNEEGFRRRSITMVSNIGTCPIVFNVWQALKLRFWGKR